MDNSGYYACFIKSSKRSSLCTCIILQMLYRVYLSLYIYIYIVVIVMYIVQYWIQCLPNIIVVHQLMIKQDYLECHSRPAFPGPDPDPTLRGSGIGTNIHFPMRVGKWMGFPAGPNGSLLGWDCRELGPRQNSWNSWQSHNIALHTNITQL